MAAAIPATAPAEEELVEQLTPAQEYMQKWSSTYWTNAKVWYEEATNAPVPRGAIRPAVPGGNDAAYYEGPIPNVDVADNNMYATLLPHLPFMFYTDAGTNQKGGKVVYHNAYKGWPRALRVQLNSDTEALMRAPFGMQQGRDKQGNPTGDPNRQNLDLAIESPALLKFLAVLDYKNVRMGKLRCKNWFKPTTKMADIDSFYKPLVSPPTMPAAGKPEFMPTLRTKVALAGKTPTEVLVKVGEEPVVDEHGNTQMQWVFAPGNFGMLTKEGLKNFQGSINIVDLCGLWFMGGNQYGDTCQLASIILVPRAPRGPPRPLLSAPSKTLTSVQAAEWNSRTAAAAAAGAAPAPMDTGASAPGAAGQTSNGQEDDYAKYGANDGGDGMDHS